MFWWWRPAAWQQARAYMPESWSRSVHAFLWPAFPAWIPHSRHNNSVTMEGSASFECVGLFLQCPRYKTHWFLYWYLMVNIPTSMSSHSKSWNLSLNTYFLCCGPWISELVSVELNFDFNRCCPVFNFGLLICYAAYVHWSFSSTNIISPWISLSSRWPDWYLKFNTESPSYRTGAMKCFTGSHGLEVKGTMCITESHCSMNNVLKCITRSRSISLVKKKLCYRISSVKDCFSCVPVDLYA